MRSGAFLCEFFSFKEKKAEGCGDNKVAEQYRSALHLSAGHIGLVRPCLLHWFSLHL